MQFLRKYPKIIKCITLSSLLSSSIWVYYQINQTKSIINNALDLSVLSITDPPLCDDDQDDCIIISPENEEYSFKRNIESLKFQIAKKLIGLMQSKNKYIKQKALQQFANLNLNYWHLGLLSNLIDGETAVSLAKYDNIPNRIFKEPSIYYFDHTQSMLLDEIKKLLIRLYERSNHSCLGVFISKIFTDHIDASHLLDYDIDHNELKKITKSPNELIPLCLESLLHHTNNETYTKDVIDLNGLPLLMEIYRRFKNNSNIERILCGIISNLSCNCNFVNEFHNTGWIGVLAKWLRYDDLKIVLPSGKALANLENKENIYENLLYLLHPLNYKVDKIDADIVFVHGLLGGIYFTWRQRKKKDEFLSLLGKNKKKDSLSPDTCSICPAKPKPKLYISNTEFQQFLKDLEEHFEQKCTCKDYEIILDDTPVRSNQNDDISKYITTAYKFSPTDANVDCYTYCWPKDWLAEDYPNLRIIGVNYDTSLSLWYSICPSQNNKTLEDRANELLNQLIKAGLGQRPIIWITHSMGGLIVKSLINKSYESSDDIIKKISLNSKGIVFYSVPHLGSSFAKLGQASSLVLWPSAEVRELEENSLKLVNIHNKFLEIARKIPITIISFVETNATTLTAMKFKLVLVEPNSGNPGIGEYYEIPQDHLTICKPSSRHSFLYFKVKELIENTIYKRQF